MIDISKIRIKNYQIKIQTIDLLLTMMTITTSITSTLFCHVPPEQQSKSHLNVTLQLINS